MILARVNAIANHSAANSRPPIARCARTGLLEVTIPRVTKTATVRDAIEPIYPGRQPFHGVTEVHVSYVESEQSAGDYTAWCTYMLNLGARDIFGAGLASLPFCTHLLLRR